MSDNIKPIAVINKATDILECLVKNPDGISLGEVSSRCNSISLQYTVSFRHLKQYLCYARPINSGLL